MTDRPAWVEALLSRQLTAVEYRVWAYLSWRQGGNGQAWPSQATIAADLSLTPRAVRGIVARLQAKGWLSVEWPGGPGRGHARNYSVRCPENRNSGSPIDVKKTGTAVPLLPEENRNGGSSIGEEKRNGGSSKTGTAVPRHKMKNTRHGTLSQRRSSVLPRRITFDRQTGTFAEIDGPLEAWRHAYPGLDVQREILRAAAWATANPDKAKKNWTRFIVNWLSRAEKDRINGHAKPQQQGRTHRPSFAGQVSTVGEVVEI